LLAFERCPRLRLARPPLVPAFDQVKVANRAVVELPVRIGYFPIAGARGLSRRIVRLSLALDGTDKIIDLRFQLAAAEHRFGTRRALVLPCRLLCRLGAPLVLGVQAQALPRRPVEALAPDALRRFQRPDWFKLGFALRTLSIGDQPVLVGDGISVLKAPLRLRLSSFPCALRRPPVAGLPAVPS
jgi:hypothetical protein